MIGAVCPETARGGETPVRLAETGLSDTKADILDVALSIGGGGEEGSHGVQTKVASMEAEIPQQDGAGGVPLRGVGSVAVV